MPRSALLPTLSDLSEDIRRARVNGLAWEAIVRADRTLQSDAVVELWYLAGFFLRMWASSAARDAWKKTIREWSGVGSRNEGSGQTPSRHSFDSLAVDLVQDAMLESFLADHIGILAKALISPPADVRQAGGVVRATVEAHEWCVLLAVLSETQGQSAFGNNRSGLGKLRNSVGGLTRSIRKFELLLSGRQRAYAAELLRNYRNSTQAFSWMPYCQASREVDIEDPLFPTKKEMAVIHKLAEQIAREFDGVEGLRSDTVRSVVEKIASAVLQRGYPAFAADINSPGLFEERDNGGSRGLLNVIPGTGSSRCAPLLLAVAKAGGKTGLRNILPSVRKHLIDCDQTTKGVIVVSDEWAPKILGDSLGDLKSHVAKGKKFVFLLAPQPGTAIVPMPISLT